VVAYYNEPLDSLRDTLQQVTKGLPNFSTHRIIIYFKGDKEDRGTFDQLVEMANEVVPIPNVGREGETYLVSVWGPATGCFAKATEILDRLDEVKVPLDPGQGWCPMGGFFRALPTSLDTS
jgi:hypothetical protein